MASPSLAPANGVAHDGYLPPDWTVPPSDWPPSQAKASKRPRSRRRIERSPSVSASDRAGGEDYGSDPRMSSDDEEDDDADETSSSWSSSSWDSELAAREAQLQWDESMRQLQALLNLVAVPWIARYFGRKWAYSLFDRYLHVGLGKRFWLGPLAVYAPRAWR
ncbi:hypothetical protein JCM3774_005948 [Rhodotorula dairenensis]